MKRHALPALLLSLVLAAPVSAATKTVELTLSAGDQDRQNTIVRVPLEVERALEGAKSVVVNVGEKTVVGQMTGPSLLADEGVKQELWFVVPALKTGEMLKVRATLSTEGAAADGTRSVPATLGDFTWKDTAGKYSELSFGERPVLRYMYEALDPERREETYKVFHHVYSPDGSRLVTKGPGGLYTHHRGLFFGFNKISYTAGGKQKSCDIWHARGAHQQHERVVSSEAGPVLGRHVVEIAWHGPDAVFATELRELSVYRVPGGNLIEFASRLETHVGPVKLDGDPQHAGFHIRADNEVAEKTSKQTYYLRPDGKGAPGQTRNWPQLKTHVDLPWNAMSFVLGDKRYTAVYLDRPQNPKEARFSERDYGRFGSYFEYELTESHPLKLNYRVWLQDGEMTEEEAARLDGDFVTPVAVRVK